VDPDGPREPAPAQAWPSYVPPPPGAARVAPHEALPPPPTKGIKDFVSKYGRMLWWAHSLYALGLGVTVVLFAQKGFAHARWLSVSLAVVWIVILLFFRLFGSGKTRAVEGKGAKVRFYVMTYVLKNLYQGMLFFLLPFYWRTAVLDAPTQWFVVALAICAALSTLDVIFDQLLMRWKVAASLFYFFTLFCCLNLVIPALFPNTRSLVTLVAAAVVAALAFWTMHVPLRFLGRPAGVALLVTWTVGSLAGAYFGRSVVPPAAMYVSSGAVGPELLDDGRLAIEASSLHHSLVGRKLYAVTDVVIPGGKGDRLVHVWRKDERVMQRSADVDVRAHGAPGTMRLQSELRPENVPVDTVGPWSVDVETEDGQLAGRVSFTVMD
jgi:hypothetical protein